MEILQKISHQVYEGDAELVYAHVNQAVESKVLVSDILNHGLMAGMERVGIEFKAGDLFIPEVLAAARAMQAGMDVIKPFLLGGEVQRRGKMVIGTIKGDLHDIGKNLVSIMLQGSGFEVVDLGVNVSKDDFIQAIREHQPQIVGMSSLLTTTMGEMKVVIEALEAASLRQQVKVMVGGAPVTEQYARSIGADGFAANASLAVDVAKEMLGISG